MAGTTKKTPAKRKPAAKKPAAEAPVQTPDGSELVAPMHPDAYKLAMRLINTSDVKGGDAETIVLVKRELARVAGQLQGDPRS